MAFPMTTNRRTFLIVSLAYGLHIPLSAKNKRKGNNNKKSTRAIKKEVKLRGSIEEVKSGVGTTFVLISNRVYTFSPSLDDKVEKFIGSTVTIYGEVIDDRIIAIKFIK